MRKRQIEILNVCLVEQKITIPELLDKLKITVSNRTIYNDLKLINSFLDANRLPTISIRRGGIITFQATANEVEIIRKHIANLDYYRYRLSAEERVEMIVKTFLLADSFVPLNSFNYMYVSRSTLVSDIEKARYILEKFEICLKGYPHYGYIIEATEVNVRNAICSLRYGESSLCPAIKQKIASAIISAEHTFALSFTDTAFNELLYYLHVTTYRIGNGHIIKWSEIENPYWVSVATHIVKAIDPKIVSFKSEILSLSNRLQTSEKLLGDNLIVNDNIFPITKVFVKKISAKLKVNFQKDLILKHNLQELLVTAINKAPKTISRKGNFLKDMLSQYRSFGEILYDEISILSKFIGRPFSDTELLGLLACIISAYNRIKQETACKLLIVCHEDAGVVQYLTTQIRKYCKVEIVGIVPAHAVKYALPVYEQKIDFIVSTLPLEYDNKPVIYADSLIVSNSIQKISYFPVLNTASNSPS